MKLRDMITETLEEQGYTEIAIADDYISVGTDDPVFYEMTFTSPTGRELVGRAYIHLDMGPGEEYSVYLPDIDEDDPDEEWEGEPRIYVTL